MAKSTRKLNIVVSVRDQTKKALGGIRARIKRFSEATSKAIGRAFKVGLAVAGVALAGFIAVIKRRFAEIDRLAKDALRFDIPIEQIAGLELAANLAGLEMNDLMTIMKDMSRRVSEAAKGTGEAQKALEELGLDAENLNKMPIEQKFQTILSALKGVGNQADKVRLADKIMGEGGVKALTMLNSSIMESVKTAELLGIALDDDLKDKVQNTNDELTRMKAAFKGIANIVVREIAEPLEDLFRTIKNGFVTIQTFLKNIPLLMEFNFTTLSLGVVKAAEFIRVKLTEAFLTPINAAIEAINEITGSSFKTREVAGSDLIDGIIADLTSQLDRIQEELDKRNANLPGDLPKPGDPDFTPPGEDELGGRSRPAPAGMPGLTGGRLLTGAAQSSAERLATIQREADAKRAKEAADARKQRDKQTQLLGDLLRSALSGNSNLGGLLQ